MKWNYRREVKHKVSKWWLGKSWVTRHGKDRACFVGIEGVSLGRLDGSPQVWRYRIERVLAALEGGAE